MPWVYLLTNVLAVVVAGLAGWRIRRLGNKAFTACMTGAAAVFGLRLLLHAHPEYEQYFLRFSDDYVYFAAWEAPLAVLMIFGLAGRLRTERSGRISLASFALLAPLFLWNSFAACTAPENTTPARFDEDGVCRQQSDYSCGPAAAVTLLRHFGQTVTEGEMSSLCLARPGRGITALELSRGLNIALRPARQQAVIERLSAADFASLRPPFLAETRRGGSTGHCVVVLRAEPDAVFLADPARGRCVSTRAEFLKQWTGIVIVPQPAPASTYRF